MWRPSYHIIDSLIPPTLEADKELNESLLRLESITSCAIVNDQNKCKTLSKIPRRLHPIIWKSYLRNEYYRNRDCQRKLDFSDLPELLYHWPDEEFILKDILPSFPAKLNWFSLFWHEYGDDYDGESPLYQNQSYLLGFCTTLIETIFEKFRATKFEDFCNTHTGECKIRKLDISGIAPLGHEHFNLNEESLLFGPVTTDIGNGTTSTEVLPYRNPFGNYAGKLEIIIDAEVHLNSDHAESMHTMEISNSNNGSISVIYADDELHFDSDQDESSHSIIRCGQLVYYGFHFIKFAKQVIGKSINKETKSIQIGAMEETEILNLMNVFENSKENINIFSFGIHGGFGPVPTLTLNFLLYLNSLQHLNMSNYNLHGKLSPFLQMKKGLHFLYLENCNLNDLDLDILWKSCHKSSLLELNLSFNKFNEKSTNLIKLCQELPNVIVLKFEKCMLENLPDKDLLLLCDSINRLPNLAHLDLEKNQFSMDIIKSHLVLLKHSPSLRLLEMMMPIKKTRTKLLRGSIEDKYAAMKKFSAYINTAINKERPMLLYVEFGDDIKYNRNRDLAY